MHAQALPSPAYQPLTVVLPDHKTNGHTLGNGTEGAMDTDMSASSEDQNGRAGSVVSMEDPDVRIAAEALGDLRADFVQSPPERPSSRPSESPHSNRTTQSDGEMPAPSQAEPLLSLLTTSHPLLSTAINGSLSAYSTSKSFSPKFKYGAEFVERHIGSPVVSTVGTVGRKTGVEGGVRWWLGGRRPSTRRLSSDEEEEGSNKRRKYSDTKSINFDMEKGVLRQSTEYITHDFFPRRESQLSQISQISQISIPESLPAYDDHRSPNYETSGALVTTQQLPSGPQSPTSTWQTRLMLSTSGLGIAMSEESLRSLKYCLTWLRWANVHIGKVIEALKDVIDEWDHSQQSPIQIKDESAEAGEATTNGDHTDSQSLITKPAPDHAALARRIAELKTDVLQTLKKVVNVVSKYAGGALPDNARLLVRRHLTSLPQRFHLASRANTPSGDSPQSGSDTVSSANRVIVLAKEGLDMMAQVSGVVDGTVASAEEWCDRLGRRKRGEPDEPVENGIDYYDQKMSNGSGPDGDERNEKVG
ncbi:MAG: hypothetical protein M1833_001804 [Piccolia ochrophora]|nr:MAG: hypothetical protein M1833_001804 [Piccolia ochrophora]